ADVLFLGNDQRVLRIVLPEHDLPLQRLLKRAFEVTQRFRSDATQARILIFNRRDAMLALGLDSRELQLFGEDIGQLVQREIDFHDVLAGISSALRFALAGLTLADNIAFLAVARA